MGPMLTGVRAAWASVACLVVVLVALVVRGSSDWSSSFGLFWYGFWAAAVALAVVGIAEAALRRNAGAHQRVLAVALSMVTLALSALLAGWILTVLSRLS
jgi:hypothetical protein